MNNNNYPTAYPATNTFQQNYMNQMNAFQNQQHSQNGNIFVTFAKGIEGAKQFPTNAGTITFIFDSTPNARNSQSGSIVFRWVIKHSLGSVGDLSLRSPLLGGQLCTKNI